MRLLVTGGCGFIGSNFIRYILKKYLNYEVVNLDKLTYSGNPDNLIDIQNNGRYRFVKGDICDSRLVKKLIENADAIVNFAASTHVDRSIEDSSDFIETNIKGVHNILEVLKNFNSKRFIHISTDEVYGSIALGCFREDSSLDPSSPYSASKAGGDLLCKAYHTTYKLPVVIARSSNNFGPYQYPEKIIPLFVTNLLDNNNVSLYGDGLNVRDWVYVEDNVRAIDLILHKGKVGEIYNIATGDEMSNLNLTKLILSNLNLTFDKMKFVKDRLGHDRRYSLNSKKLEGLGWRSIYSFKKALEITIEWYKNNRLWWEKIKLSKDYIRAFNN